VSEKSIDELTLGQGISLDDLVDRKGLSELVHSFFELFRVPLRIFSADGTMLADSSEQAEIYRYLNGVPKTRGAVDEVVNAVKKLNPGVSGEVSYQCFTGAMYEVVGISYDERRIGRMVLGPFLPPSVKEIPQSLMDIEPSLDTEEVKRLLGRLARARPETVAQIARHLRSTLDLILFSGHKALLTSSMHLASVRESFRDLQEKNTSLQEAYDQLKELDRLKSNFLATVSHELRTPLTSIIGYSEMLVEGLVGELPADQKEFVRTIHEKGEQLLELITGLLDLSKLESGTLSMNRENLDVGVLVADVVTTLTPHVRKKGVRLEIDVAGDVPELYADPTRLRQIITNLADNAIKFTPPNGTVTLGARVGIIERNDDDDDGDGSILFAGGEPAVELRVADTGIGISDAEKNKVFDAFYQVDSSSTREAGGTGLGLSIVHRLVAAHRGLISIEDNHPTGAVFVVRLPIANST
jgi:signal transduction histidine kinase